jgi:hypothetical protein
MSFQSPIISGLLILAVIGGILLCLTVAYYAILFLSEYIGIVSAYIIVGTAVMVATLGIFIREKIINI